MLHYPKSQCLTIQREYIETADSSRYLTNNKTQGRRISNSFLKVWKLESYIIA